MEYLSLHEIHDRVKDIEAAIESLLTTKALTTRPHARQWEFLRESMRRLLSPGILSEFDSLPAVQAAQLKFEVEDKLRRFYLRPGRPLNFVFTLVHRSALDIYGVDDPDKYPALANYCLLVRDLSSDHAASIPDTASDVKVYLERVVTEAIDAEFKAYAALPTIEIDMLLRWFCAGSPALNEIVNLLARHQKKGWIISNPMNPSTKRLLSIKVRKVGNNEAIVNTVEYWYLRWWADREDSYTYPYRETNRQIYVLKKDPDGWKVYENLRPSPRTSVPHRWAKRQKAS